MLLMQVAHYFYALGVPFAHVESPEFKGMLKAVEENARKGFTYTPMSRKTLSTSQLKKVSQPVLLPPARQPPTTSLALR